MILNAKQYLMSIKYKTERIAEQEEYIQRLRNTLGVSGISYDKDRVQTSKVGDKTAEIICKIVDEEEKLENMQQVLMKLRIKILDQIRQIENENYRKVLNVVYVDMHNLKECSRIIGFSYDYVRELHIKALNSFEEKFPHHTS